jgi:hypothetical protein
MCSTQYLLFEPANRLCKPHSVHHQALPSLLGMQLGGENRGMGRNRPGHTIGTARASKEQFCFAFFKFKRKSAGMFPWRRSIKWTAATRVHDHDPLGSELLPGLRVLFSVWRPDRHSGTCCSHRPCIIDPFDRRKT